jgi:hypothetical protein
MLACHGAEPVRGPKARLTVSTVYNSRVDVNDQGEDPTLPLYITQIVLSTDLI